MANALVYCQSGGGKTVNSTRVTIGKRGKNLLLCSDNSHIVLNQFDRPNLEVGRIENWYDKDKTGNTRPCFATQFEQAVDTQKYDNIIVDNLSDLFDLAILELDECGKFKDMRQAYQIVYQALKRLVRKAGMLDCNIIFTAWADQIEVTLSDGTKAMRISPKLPAKILDNVCGLCNIVAYINTAPDKAGNKQWYYVLEGSQTLYAKDQIQCRKSCMPEDIFTETKNKESKEGK